MALLAVVVALWLPEIAAASCGSHVTFAGDTHAARPLCKPGVDCPLLPATPPCNGPGCSQAPDSPPLGSTTAPYRASDDSALAALFVVVPDQGSWSGMPPLLSHTIHLVYPPDPPPRFADPV